MHDPERRLIDPENRYPADGMRRVEKHALRLLQFLDEPVEVIRTRDAIQVDAGGEKGIVLLVTREALELRLPSLEWTRGAYGPARTSRLWRRIEWDDMAEDELYDLLGAARRARRQEYTRCRYCGELVPPERRFSEDVCHGCASGHLGVVY